MMRVNGASILQKKKNLINAFSIAYDKLLFNKETFGVFFENPKHSKFYIEEICINVTEFDNGLNFRFGNNNNLQTKIGNQYLYFKRDNKNIEQVKKIKLSDILAASSCFPAGFEPIMFPRDFAWKENEEGLSVESLNEAITQISNYNDQETEPSKLNYEISVGFMDGGIDDNQGIYAFLLADDRKKGYDYDLFMACDVSSNYLNNSFKYPYANNKLSPDKTIKGYLVQFSIFILLPLLLLLVVGFVLLTLKKKLLAVALISVATTSILIPIFTFFLIKSHLFPSKKKFKSENTWLIVLNKYKTKLLSLPLQTIVAMLLARLKSVLLLADTVYLKKIRRSSYSMLFDKKSIDMYSEKINTHNLNPSLNPINTDRLWSDNILMTALHLLATKNDFQLQRDLAKESWIKSAKNPNNNIDLLESFLHPSKTLRAIIDVAVEIDTTLWFDENHTKKEALKCLLIAGQATTCFNLLRMVNRFPNNNPDWTNLKNRLFEDWQKFQINPDWMYNNIS